MSGVSELRYTMDMNRLGAQRDKLQACIDAALALHPNVDGDCFECDDGRGGSVPWPCRTVKALLGDKS